MEQGGSADSDKSIGCCFFKVILRSDLAEVVAGLGGGVDRVNWDW